MISKLSIICLFVISSVNSTNGLNNVYDFCQEYRQNNDKIQYYFRRYYKDEPQTMTKIFLVIKGKCWAIDFKHDKSAEPTLSLDQKSKSCPIFTAEYPFGLCLNTKKFEENSKYDCDAYLFNIDSGKGVIAKMNNDGHLNYRELVDYTVRSNITLSGHESAKPSISVFQSNRKQTFGLLIFVGITADKLSAKLFDFELKGNQFVFKEDDPNKVYADYPVDIEIKELLLLIYQFNYNSETKEKGNGWGFIVLEKKDTRIFWCWTSALKYNCIPSLLVDCIDAPGPGPAPGPDPDPGVTDPSGPPEAPTTVEKEEKEKGSVWIIIVIILIAIVVAVAVIAIFGGVVFFIKNRNNEELEAATSQASASDADEPSKRTLTSMAPSAVASKAGGPSAQPTGAATPSTSKAAPSPSGQSAQPPSPKKA